MNTEGEKHPDARLLSCIPFLHHGGKVADIGTDHAYLPIYLIKEGYSREALACDINRGPIQRAEQNIRAAGLSDKIGTLLTDGLHGVENFAPDDILIFGMGGELIANILFEAPWVKKAETYLILQPMTKPEILRRWLNENGFYISGEALSFEGQIYQTIHAVFDGTSEQYSPLELLVGKKNLTGNSPLLLPYLEYKAKGLHKVIEGKKRSENADVSTEEALLAEIEDLKRRRS